VLPRAAQSLPNAAAQAVPMPTLAERERALQTSTLGGAPPDYSYRALSQDAAATQAPPPQGATAGAGARTDRPPPGTVAAASGTPASGNSARKPAAGADRYRAPASPRAPPPSYHPSPPTASPAHAAPAAPAAAPAHASSVHADAAR
jgi:hypothetical protein